MLPIRYTSANSHLGDIAWHCQILQSAEPWENAVSLWTPLEYRWQVQEMLEGLPVDIRDQEPPDGLSTWIACGRFEPTVQYQHDVDLIDYLSRWGFQIQKEIRAGGWLGAEQQNKTSLFRRQLLTSFPAILRNVVAPDFEVLIVNAPPRSGQCPQFDQGQMEDLIYQLAGRHKVLCTNELGVKVVPVPVISGSLCNIGNLSLRAKLVVGVASGPIWGCLNIWRTCPIYLLLDPIRLNYGYYPINHAVSVADLTAQLTRDGWL